MGGAMGAARGMFGGGGGAPPAAAGQMAARPGFAAMLSDERSKQRIEELEDQRDRYLDLMDNDKDATSDAFRGVHDYSYEYKPEFQGKPGTAPGRQRGAMAHELRPLGVTMHGDDGFERVDNERLPLKTAGEVGTQRRELDDTRAEVEDLRAKLAELEDDPQAQLDVAGGRGRR